MELEEIEDRFTKCFTVNKQIRPNSAIERNLTVVITKQICTNYTVSLSFASRGTQVLWPCMFHFLPPPRP